MSKSRVSRYDVIRAIGYLDAAEGRRDVARTCRRMGLTEDAAHFYKEARSWLRLARRYLERSNVFRSV